MKRNQFSVGLVIAMVLITAIVAGIFLWERKPAVEGVIRVEKAGVSVDVPLDSMDLRPVQGERKNGKGEVLKVSGQGFPLAELLRAAGFELTHIAQAEVTADDGYYATVAGDELAGDNVFLLFQEEGGVRLMVFGDENSKRSVSNVAVVTLREDA